MDQYNILPLLFNYYLQWNNLLIVSKAEVGKLQDMTNALFDRCTKWHVFVGVDYHI